LRKRIGVGGVLAVLLACTALCRSGIDADGTAVLWFHGSQVTAEVEGQLVVDGLLDIDGTKIAFTARGTAVGEAIGDSAAGTFEVWILFAASGAAETGETISLRGGITGSSASADPTSGALGSTVGPFFLLVSFEQDVYQARGTADGSAVGAFVVPADPLTMQMEGTATYALVGDLVSDPVHAGDGEPPRSAYLGCLPWDAASWPAALLTRLLALLDGDPIASGAEPQAEPADD